MSLYLEVEENKIGRDFVVGDIHGDFANLVEKLEGVSFDPKRDRLFCLGDLVDRGDKNEEVVSLIDNEVFYSILGNHELLLLAGFEDPTSFALHSFNGGEWFSKLDTFSKYAIHNKLKRLPFAIEIPIGNKRIGLIHAEVPDNNWHALKDILSAARLDDLRFDSINSDRGDGILKMLNIATWSRKLISSVIRKDFSINPKLVNSSEFNELFTTRYNDLVLGKYENDIAKSNFNTDRFIVDGIDHVYVGHNILPIKCTFGDYNYIDTGGYLPNGDLTLVNLTELYA